SHAPRRRSSTESPSSISPRRISSPCDARAAVQKTCVEPTNSSGCWSGDVNTDQAPEFLNVTMYVEKTADLRAFYHDLLGLPIEFEEPGHITVMEGSPSMIRRKVRPA